MAIPNLNEIIHFIITAYTNPVNRPLFELTGMVLLTLVLYIVYWLSLYFLNKRKTFYVLEIQLPSSSNEEEAIDKMQSVLSSLHSYVYSNTNKLSFEIYKVESYISIQIGSNNKQLLERVSVSLKQVRNIVIKEVAEDSLTKIQPLYCKTVSNVKDFYPVSNDPHFFANLLTLLNSFPDDESLGVQFILRGVNKNAEMQRRRRSLENKAVKQRRRQTDRETYLYYVYQKKQESNLFKMKINVVANKKSNLSSLIAQIKLLNFEENIFYSRGEGKRNVLTRFISPDTYFSNIHTRRKHEGTYLNSKELAYLIHPTSVTLGSLDTKQTNTIEARPDFLKEQSDNILIGEIENQKAELQSLYFPLQNFARHIFAIGKTGSGKSSLLVTMLKTLMQKAGNTVFVFDPHGDLLTDILNAAKSIKNIVYLNIRNTDRIYTFNPLFAFQKSTIHKAVVRDKILDIIKNETEELSGSTTTGNATYNRMRQMLDVALEFPDAYFAFLTEEKGQTAEKAEMLVRERQLTLNDIPYLLEKNYGYTLMLEKIFVNNTSEAGLYIRKLMPDHMKQQAVNEAMQTRFSQLLHPSSKLIYEGNSLSIEKVLTSGKTFLFPIPDSIFGTHGSRGLLQLLFSLIWINKQEVGKKEDRRDTYIVIDEFQNAQIEDIPKILSEARKYKLYLIASNQYLGQLKEKILHAIFGNIGTLISFTVGAGENGSKTLAENFGDTITENDLTNLPSHSAYMKTKIPNKDESMVFSFTTIPVEEKEKSEFAIDNINDASLKEYGELKSDLEAKLRKKQESPAQYFLEGI